MAVENGEWIMRGLEWDNPYRIHSWQELVRWIEEVGFCPCSPMRLTGSP